MPMTLDQMRSRYIALFGLEPVENGVLEQIESELGINFPSDFRTIATFYSGGIVGGISHHAIGHGGNPNNITSETMRLREAVRLPHSIVTLAEPPESLIVLETERANEQPSVFWIDGSDVSRLGEKESIRSPQVWPSYSDFFQFLLEREADDREEGVDQDRGGK
jgi:hypothetical protein